MTVQGQTLESIADDHVADDNGGGVNIGGGGDLRALAAIGANVGLAAQP